MYDPVVTDAFVTVHLEISATVSETHPARPAPSRNCCVRRVPPSPPSRARAVRNGEVSATLLALSDLATEIGGLTTVEDLAVTLGSRVRQTVPCDLIVFYLRDRVSDDMVAAHAAGAGSEVFKGLRLKSGEGLSGWVAINKLTIMNSSGALDLADRRERLPVALESALATPLCAGEDVVGVLTLYSAARNSFTTEHQQVVEFAARQIGPALGRALSFEQERMASLFDAETGLPNEKYLERVLASAVYCRRRGQPQAGAADAAGGERQRQARAGRPRAAPGRDIEDGGPRHRPGLPHGRSRVHDPHGRHHRRRDGDRGPTRHRGDG